ncbi:hypothetical protein HR060_04990 [Catenovulum sp. SM1970]|uniref:hypothetical protein n=1 Tax=Marinifaba aquimaris TaxID=2741323 RepID=UPI001572BFAF|nr:hypothetical protein [Marinifaba aquimaris]NTS76217.1 hypothetical protein [Marinifaba aquimaris]
MAQFLATFKQYADADHQAVESAKVDLSCQQCNFDDNYYGDQVCIDSKQQEREHG